MSLTWGPRRTHVSFFSLLPWELGETCREQKGEAASEASGTPCWGPQPAGRCWGEDTPLPGKAGSAGRLASLKACGDAERAAVGTATSPPVCPLRGTTGWGWRALSPRWHYSRCCCRTRCCQEGREGRGDLGDQGGPGGGEKTHQGVTSAKQAVRHVPTQGCGCAPRHPAGSAMCEPTAGGTQPPRQPLFGPLSPPHSPCARPGALTRRPSMPLMSAGSPFSPFSPFMPGRPCG